MRSHLALAAALVVLGAAPARADTVRLKNGHRIDNVKAVRDGDGYRLLASHGETRVAVRDVAEVLSEPTVADRLLEKLAAAGQSPERLRDLAVWCAENGLSTDQKALVAKARKLELDRTLAALARTGTADDYLGLVHRLEHDPASTPAERVPILALALARDSNHPEVRRLLGQVEREGRWLAIAEDARLTAEAEERAMRARGLVRYDGRWMAAETVALVEERRGIAREREALSEERTALAAERARSEEASAQLAAERRAAAAETERLEAARRLAAREADRLACERRELALERGRLEAARRACP